MKNYTVYLIKENGVIRYVGVSSNFNKRKERHKYERGTHSSAIPKDVDLSTIEFVKEAEFNNEADALRKEDELIMEYNTINNGWNKRRSGMICKNRKKEYMQDYYVSHKEEIDTRVEKWKEENKEHLQEWYHNYCQTEEYKEKNRIRSAKRNQSPEGKAYKHEWYLKNKAKKM